MSFYTRWKKVPFYSNPDLKLLQLGRRDAITMRTAFQNFLAVGGTGSGKTSSLHPTLLQALLNSGAGFLILCAKPEERATILKVIKRAKRARDVIIMDATAKERFNILDHVSRTLAKDGFEHNYVELMRIFSEAMNVASANSDGGENSFFLQAALKWLSHTFPLLLAALGNLRLKDVYEMVISAPRSVKQASDPKWQEQSFCWKILYTVSVKAEHGDVRAQRALDEHGDYWIEEIAPQAEKTRSSVEATLTNLIYPFLSGKLAELFCTDTTFTPDDARDGKIIILDLPVLTYGPMGAAAQSIFKYLFGLAMQSKPAERNTRPVVLWADECQYFLSATDAELLSTARSAKLCCVFITQDIPTFYAQLGHQQRDVADSIIGKFGTRLFYANTSRQTNQQAADLIGKTQKYNRSKTTSKGLNSGGSLNQSEWVNGAGAGDGRNQTRTQSISSYEDYIFPPEFFAKGLRTGGPKNRKRVDAIIIRSGATFNETGAHWIKAEFHQ